MARQKNVTITQKRVPIKWNSAGKPIKFKTVKEKSVVKSTNVTRGNNPGGQNWKTDSAAIKSEQISAKTNRERIKQEHKTARTAAIAGSINNAISQAVGRNSYTKNTAVEQLVNGGATQSSNRRDDDEDEKSPWVD